jgi:hypothetical protein
MLDLIHEESNVPHQMPLNATIPCVLPDELKDASEPLATTLTKHFVNNGFPKAISTLPDTDVITPDTNGHKEKSREVQDVIVHGVKREQMEKIITLLQALHIVASKPRFFDTQY